MHICKSRVHFFDETERKNEKCNYISILLLVVVRVVDAFHEDLAVINPVGHGTAEKFGQKSSVKEQKSLGTKKGGAFLCYSDSERDIKKRSVRPLLVFSYSCVLLDRLGLDGGHRVAGLVRGG